MNCFNGEEFLAEAVASVVAQTYQDWELIFWDNRSTDDSARILKSFQDPRIKYYLAPRHTNLSAARNKAIAKAGADWIAFLDCDDIWLPAKLEKQFQRMESDPGAVDGRPLGVLYGRSLMIHSDGRESELLPQFRNRELPEGNILAQLLSEGDFIAFPTVMIKRAALDEVGGINEQYTCAADYYFLAAICEKYRALAVQDHIAKYRIHGKNLTFSLKDELYREPLSILETWGHHIDSKLLAKRKREYHTLLSAHYWSRNMFVAATRELLQNGSFAFLAGRFVSRFRSRLSDRK